MWLNCCKENKNLLSLQHNTALRPVCPGLEMETAVGIKSTLQIGPRKTMYNLFLMHCIALHLNNVKSTEHFDYSIKFNEIKGSS